MRLFGLIGYPLTQSFSKKYFSEKFENENITNVTYELFCIDSIDKLPEILAQTALCGLNVTIPYKQDVLQFLTETDEEARQIGAVNCIKVTEGSLKGFNTDAPAFEQSLAPLLKPHHQKALVLGTGGAAKAVVYVLNKLGIDFKFVSRTPKEGRFSYTALDKSVMADYTLIVNCTPLGSYPKTEGCPAIPFEFVTEKHLLYDLVYNPPVTAFLQQGADRGATIKNGYDMLVGQAELSWQIWNS